MCITSTLYCSITEVNSRLGETARQRRRTRLKKRDTQKPLTASREIIDASTTDQVKQPELEDSTAGVASLLQKKLYQTEQEHNTSHLDNQTGHHDPPIVHSDEHLLPHGSNEHSGIDAAVEEEQEPVTRLGELY